LDLVDVGFYDWILSRFKKQKEMKKILRFFRHFINNNTLRVVKFNKLEVKIFLDVFYFMKNTKSEVLLDAMDILVANNEFWYMQDTHEFVLFGKELKALSDMLNDYCILITEDYGAYSDVAKDMLASNYNKCTDLHLKLV
jgi:hypothetical protein